MSVCSTACSPTFPFREPASAPSNSIQPSLKPSSILMRGVGFFMPCDLNSDSQVSRGTGSILTGRPSRSAKVVAISLGGNHRYRLIDGLREAQNHAVIGRRSDIPATVLHEPSWPQKGNRHRQLSKHLLDNGVLRKQVRLSRLCADGGQIYDSARTRCR